MTKLAVSIVLYGSDLTMLAQAIHSLAGACEHAARSFALSCTLDLVNNKPHDDRKQAIRDLAGAACTAGLAITFIDAGVNGGYGAGNNISIRRHADADFHLVLNPDVLVSEASLSNALAYLAANPQVGLLTPQVRGLDGELHYLCKRHPTLFDMVLRSVPSAAVR